MKLKKVTVRLRVEQNPLCPKCGRKGEVNVKRLGKSDGIPLVYRSRYCKNCHIFYNDHPGAITKEFRTLISYLRDVLTIRDIQKYLRSFGRNISRVTIQRIRPQNKAVKILRVRIEPFFYEIEYLARL